MGTVIEGKQCRHADRHQRPLLAMGGALYRVPWIQAFPAHAICFPIIGLDGGDTFFIYPITHVDFDHGVGHPLLLLCNAKAPNYRKNKASKDSGNYSEWPKVADAVIEALMSLNL